ncbi:SPFH domain-containing protein [Loigolactobacillus bifermentans]|uniref:Virion core protein n=1 Tax=Loigolactobacillus bifermentans DSM 20003 TaxID=1423726 RepID=A0A0R1H7H2_9LACO|nr:SPFH domain-containing protein [Loigolactobacillus bifermentans]KRK39908.1 hypothetical protein FC07_GL002155 [Loigolactobacillus bifermentans DSM 20003]QGG61339.1 SPFH domain-containing protein [Loigolactobacillus bifermentans]
MGLIKAFSGAINGTLADQWKDVITAAAFDEHTVIVPGVNIRTNHGRGSNFKASTGIITVGSKIYVPENTAMFIFDQGGIETVVTEAGGYEYSGGQETIFAGGSLGDVFDQTMTRVEFGGQPNEYKYVAFINLREIRGIKFGTRGPQPYHDKFYDVDLEVLSYGNLSIRITNPITFVKNFIPANTSYYSFDDREAKSQLLSEFLQSFGVVLNSLSSEYRISELPAQGATIAARLMALQTQTGNWQNRFGIVIEAVGIESIQFSDESRALVKQFSSNRMDVNAYSGVSDHASNIAAQQKMAKGIQNNGLGDGAGALLGVNLTQDLLGEKKSAALDLDQQIELVQKLKALLDSGILTEAEFTAKKKEIMGL